MSYLLFDVGGTKMRLAVSTDGQTFGEPKVVPTPTTVGETVRLFKKTADELTASTGGLTGVCGGVTRRREAAKASIAKLFSVPTVIENDTALVGLGEAHGGAGQGAKIMAYVTVSTGVGGVRIVDGRIDHAAVGFEPGHQIINFDDAAQKLEDYVSGMAVERLRRTPPNAVLDPDFWRVEARYLAYGLHNLIVHWSPELIVLGGGMFKPPAGLEVEVVREELQKIMTVFPSLPTLRPAALGDFGGLHGALVYLRG